MGTAGGRTVASSKAAGALALPLGGTRIEAPKARESRHRRRREKGPQPTRGSGRASWAPPSGVRGGAPAASAFLAYLRPTEQPIKAHFFVKSPLNRSIRGAWPLDNLPLAIFFARAGALGFSGKGGGTAHPAPPLGYGPGWGPRAKALFSPPLAPPMDTVCYAVTLTFDLLTLNVWRRMSYRMSYLEQTLLCSKFERNRTIYGWVIVGWPHFHGRWISILARLLRTAVTHPRNTVEQNWTIRDW